MAGSNHLLQYTQGATRKFNVTGVGRQEAELLGDLHSRVVAQSMFGLPKMDLVNGIGPESSSLGLKL